MEALWSHRFPENAFAGSVEFKADEMVRVQPADGIRKALPRVGVRIARQRVVNACRPALFFKHLQDGLLMLCWLPVAFAHLTAEQQLSPFLVPARFDG